MLIQNWDEYFINIAEAVSKKSHCLSHQFGCVIVKNKQILSTGFNGPPAGYSHCDDESTRVNLHVKYTEDTGDMRDKGALFTTTICPRKMLGFGSSDGLQYCSATHAELNAILQAARNGTSTIDSSLYCSFANTPCRECAKAIVNAGILKVYLKGPSCGVYDKKGIIGLDILKKCNISVEYT